MAYNAKAQKKYREEKTLQATIKYTPTDIYEGKRLKAYIEQSGKTANSYIKELIKNDLDNKGFNIPDQAEQDTD